VTTSPGAVTPAAGLRLVPALLGLVRFQHTVFALPFALAGALLARHAVPSIGRLAWIVLAMAGARTLAMALNRLIDEPIDALNPRTAGRELPSGRLSRGQVAVFAAVSLGVLLLAVSQLPSLTWYLWPIPVAAFVIYPYTKRLTWGCHLMLGFTIGMAPVGGWIAVTGEIDPAAIVLGAGVAAWIAGFDAIYALLDVDFDRSHGIHSIPASFGTTAALWFARGSHLAAVVLLAAGGLLAGAGVIYLLGITVIAIILAYGNVIVRPDDEASIQKAFGSANALVSVVYLVFVLAEVTLS